ncbi:response regulator [Lichenihabitans sp. PAMC28606]|uniref:response regulator n=1 Tax=Lichenihabitans sp. PAMC28606 TaxID=2880932 RepID=UPI001D0AC16C|nr:response regulator [Lichenihabitans sp. PAMC28606]UDL94717.1 response regulator [Lichenihabitans sp. PAMC28606]
MQRSILVVEDEPLIRMDIVSMLEDAGLLVVDFDNAEDALDFIQPNVGSIGGIFTDVNVRGVMTGIELASQIMRIAPRMTILMTSGGYIARPDNLPITTGFVVKPWLPLEVIAAMRIAANDPDSAAAAHDLMTLKSL